MLPAALRLIHPAPASAVVLLSAALGAILLDEAGRSPDGRLLLVVLSIAGSQVATGAFNDWADRRRDATGQASKPIPAGELRPRTAVAIGVGGVILQLASSAPLGCTALLLGAAPTASALAYDFLLSRTPASVLPYLVSFGLLPLWIAAGLGLPLERVVGASLLVAPFAAAAHLANTLRDFDADAASGSRSLAQVIGRRRSRVLALGLAGAVGAIVAIGLGLLGQLRPVSLGLGVIGLVAVAQGAGSARRLWYGLLLAAVCWTVAWGLATG
ncbi:MAG TPA: UbiA family prenyltransferase [Candidatus Limnocylindria bacterium]|nr:UbiA family prenyltransferase [Candidatus Limnocylindria bacterium]